MLRLLSTLIFASIYNTLTSAAGVISPDATNPIVMERTNEGATSSYTFYLSLSTRLPASTGVIVITFPSSTFTDPSRNPSLSLTDFDDFTFIKTSVNQVTVTQGSVY